MCDMAGNVLEWTRIVSGIYRFLRGGSWHTYDDYCTVAYRYIFDPPYLMYPNIGFRMCR